MEKPPWWNTDCWATPPALVSTLEAEFGKFDLDPCCRAETAKASRFYTETDDGLKQPWFGKVFMNPPYSNPAPWVRKAVEVTQSGAADLVCALLPVCTETRWFHAFVQGIAEVRFIKGRIRFLGWEGVPSPSPRAPSMLAIYHTLADLRADAT